MYLVGFGDPTNGHGGINYIKYPLKISRYESKLMKIAKEEDMDNLVSGSPSDLRGLSMDIVHRLLIKHGRRSEEVLAKLERWDKIDLLRKYANLAAKKKVKTPDDYEIIKYSRNTRMTT